MSNKKPGWLQQAVLAIKLLLTALTVISYFHYFNHQSWGYFTIDPKQPLINIYAVSSQGVISKDPVLKNNAGYDMGMSRKGIFLYNKLADVISYNKNLVWKKLNGDSLVSIAATSGDIGAINYNNFDIGRGRFVITRTDREHLGGITGKKNDLPVTYYTITDIR